MNHYDMVLSTIESVKRDIRPRGAPISKPIPLASEEEEDIFTGMEAFDLEPIEVVRDGKFKLKTGKWG